MRLLNTVLCATIFRSGRMISTRWKRLIPSRVVDFHVWQCRLAGSLRRDALISAMAVSINAYCFLLDA